MARLLSGATVLLIFLIAAVSVYTCAVLGGIDLGRTLESSKRSPAAAATKKLQLLFGFSSTKIAVSYTHNGRHTTEEQPSSSLSPWPTVVPSSLGGASFFVSRAYDGQQTRNQDGNESFVSGEIVAATKVGPWGGSGGQPFYLRTTGGGTVRLRSVTLYHSDAIHAFSYDYVGESGRRITQGGMGGNSRRSAGTIHETIYLSPGEHITAVEGTFGRWRSMTQVIITSLTFRTDKGSTHGPYGRPSGVPFSVPIANGCIIGFWGRSGWLLDAIGVYVAPCKVYKASL